MKQWYEFLFNSALQLVMFNTTTYLVCIIIKYVQYLQNECGVVAVPPKVYFQTSQSRLKFLFLSIIILPKNCSVLVSGLVILKLIMCTKRENHND